jgi:hypothetical protein
VEKVKGFEFFQKTLCVASAGVLEDEASVCLRDWKSVMSEIGKCLQLPEPMCVCEQK